MPEPMPARREPSLLNGSLVGYAAGAVVGAILAFVQATRVGGFGAKFGFQSVFGLGLLGVIAGYKLTVVRRRARGVAGPFDEPRRFYRSSQAWVIATVLLFGSFALSSLSAEVYRASTAKP
jgi:hypothetical protein